MGMLLPFLSAALDEEASVLSEDLRVEVFPVRRRHAFTNGNLFSAFKPDRKKAEIFFSAIFVNCLQLKIILMPKKRTWVVHIWPSSCGLRDRKV